MLIQDDRLLKDGTIIERCKGLVDWLNAHYCQLPTNFADSTYSIAFYDSVIAIEKKQWPKGVRIMPVIPSDIGRTLTVEELLYVENLYAQQQIVQEESEENMDSDSGSKEQ